MAKPILNKEDIKLLIESLDELCEELSEASHGTLVTEQWDLHAKLKSIFTYKTMAKQTIKIFDLKRYLGILSQMSAHTGHGMSYEIALNTSIIEPIVAGWVDRTKKLAEETKKKQEATKGKKKLEEIATESELHFLKLGFETTEIEFKLIEVDSLMLELLLKKGVFQGVSDLGSLFGKIIIITENGKSDTDGG